MSKTNQRKISDDILQMPKLKNGKRVWHRILVRRRITDPNEILEFLKKDLEEDKFEKAVELLTRDDSKPHFNYLVGELEKLGYEVLGEKKDGTRDNLTEGKKDV